MSETIGRSIYRRKAAAFATMRSAEDALRKFSLKRPVCTTLIPTTDAEIEFERTADELRQKAYQAAAIHRSWLRVQQEVLNGGDPIVALLRREVENTRY